MNLVYGGAWPWMQFLTYLGYVPGVTHFPPFSAPKRRKVSSENSVRGVLSSNCNSPLQKILWDRRRYNWKIRVCWLRFWHHDVNWKPAKQIVGENTTESLKIITLIITIKWLLMISGLLHNMHSSDCKSKEVKQNIPGRPLPWHFIRLFLLPFWWEMKIKLRQISEIWQPWHTIFGNPEL